MNEKPSMDEGRGRLWLVRHSETSWSASGRHTGLTDIPLTAKGRRQAATLRERLAGRPFSLVLSSPLSRARQTGVIAGYADAMEFDDDLREWDYGEYEGLTTGQIREKVPDWTIWRADPPGGEAIEEVAQRARRVISRAKRATGDVLLISHGHLLRVLAACWSGLPPAAGRLLSLDAASLSILGYEHETQVIILWNEECKTRPEEKA